MDFSLTEIIGYLASLVVLCSFTMKDIKKLRIVNGAGCALFVVYGFLLHYSYPIIITNVCIIGIHVWYLTRPHQPQ